MAESWARGARWGRRALGVILLALSIVPVYRILLDPATGNAGLQTVQEVDLARELLWWGFLGVLLTGLLVGLIVTEEGVTLRVRGMLDNLTRPRLGFFALTTSLVATLATTLVAWAILDGRPSLIDAMVELLHARYWATGQLAGPTASNLSAFWHTNNSIITESGWISHFPPGHIALLALGFMAGGVMFIGPLCVGATVFFSALSVERLLPERKEVARLAALAVTLNPFLIGPAAAYMSHAPAAAAGTTALYFMLRARDGSSTWAIAGGLALGVAFATRPYVSLALAPVLGLGPLLLQPSQPRGWWGRRILSLVAGGLPLGLLVAAYNAHFMGDPFEFTYLASWGPAHKLGFHLDPWGNSYSPLIALAYTSADLHTLSLRLLEAPLPIVPAVAIWLTLARRLSGVEHLVLLWAIVPVFANLFYWHHGQFMGPRMLNEVAPAWAILFVLAAARLYRAAPSATLGGNWSPRATIAATLFLGGVVGSLYLAPQRLISYGGKRADSIQPDVSNAPEGSLVFVHGGWKSRLAMRLAADGMRLDSLEVLLRENPTCDVDAYVRHRIDGVGERPELTFNPEARPQLVVLEITRGNTLNAPPDLTLSQECLREIRADQSGGIIPVTPLQWLGALPGNSTDLRPLFVHDLGPELNKHLIKAYPERPPYLLVEELESRAPVFLPYDEGMERLWGTHLDTTAVRLTPVRKKREALGRPR